MNIADDDGKPFSDKYLRDIIMNFMYAAHTDARVALSISRPCLWPKTLTSAILHSHSIAGRDTTAQTLTWMFYLLSEHPDIRQQVRDRACKRRVKELSPTLQ
jgi:cytochrome P450